MTKKYAITAFILTVLLVFSTSAAFAEEYTGSSGWKVNWNGTDLTSNFTSGSVNDSLSQLEPGDTVSFKVTLKNNASEAADWWMSNDVLDSFEDNSQASGGAYTYKLTYGSTELYNSDAVGGESTVGGTGLHQATSSMKDYFYLGKIASGGSETVQLSITLDGATQGNDYQGTQADIKLVFAAENIATGGNNHDGNKSTNKIRTGDDFQFLLICILAITSGLILLALGIRRLRKSAKQE